MKSRKLTEVFSPTLQTSFVVGDGSVTEIEVIEDDPRNLHTLETTICIYRKDGAVVVLKENNFAAIYKKEEG